MAAGAGGVRGSIEIVAMRQKAKSTDPGWNYGSYAYPGKSINAIKCHLCGKISEGGIYRHKQHLTQAGGNVTPCSKVTPEIRKEIEDYMESQTSKKKRFDRAPGKGYSTSREESSGDFTSNDENVENNDVEGSRKKDDEISMTTPTNVRKRRRVSCSADTHLTHNDEEKELFQISKDMVRIVETTGKWFSLHPKDMERIVETTARWFSLTGVPIEKVRERLQEIGCFGAGPPPSCRELRESFLKKEARGNGGLPCHRCGNKDRTAFFCRGSSSCEHCHEAGHGAIKCPARRRSEESPPPLVIIPLSKEISAAERQLGSCGVLSFESEIGSEKDVVDRLSSVGHWNRSLPIRRLDENAFLVQFPSERALQEAKEHLSTKYRNPSLLCRPWSKTDGEKRNPSSVWIKVGGFPLHCWDTASFQSLVASFGSLEEQDRKTEERSELSEARLRISCLDPSKIPSSIDVMVGKSIYAVDLLVEGCPNMRSSRDQGLDLDVNPEDVRISAEDATQQTDSSPVPVLEPPGQSTREEEPGNVTSPQLRGLSQWQEMERRLRTDGILTQSRGLLHWQEVKRRLITIRILNHWGLGRFDFFVQWKALASHPIPNAGTEDVPNYSDSEMLAGILSWTYESEDTEILERILRNSGKNSTL